uniref:Ribonuclease P/MRP 40 subunit n=1 Tax=Sander lucioperca TaxID=283035 RepID=A0A8C9Y489_SANLU
MSPDLERTPRNLLVSERSSFLDQRTGSALSWTSFGLVTAASCLQVCVLLPECSSAPSHLDSALNTFSSFYLIRKLPLYELLDTHFLETVRHGGVSGLSYRTRLDEDNCVALMPNGKHSLLELLGVEGKPSRFNHRTKSRFVVCVDLTDSSMAPGERGYQRLVTGLTSRLPLKTDFLMSLPGGGASVQALLSRYDWSEHRPEVSSCSLTDLLCPAPLTSDPPWLGAVHLPVLAGLSEPNKKLSHALRVSVCGLLSHQDVQKLIQEIRVYLSVSPPGSASWASVTLHGFVDSPVSWGGEEHGVLRGGDNFLSLMMFPDQSYLLHLATGAHDTCPP